MRKIISIVFANMLFFALNVGAVIIVDYQFVDNASIPDSSDADLLTVAGEFAAGSGITMGVTSAISVSNRSLLNDNNGFYAPDEISAITVNDYFSFTISVIEKHKLELNRLSFAVLRFPGSGAGAPRAYSLRTSQDGFSSTVGTGTVDVAASDSTSEPFFEKVIDLSGLNPVTDGIEFRLYFYDRDTAVGPTNRQFRLDDVVVEGAVSTVANIKLIVITSK